MKVGLFIPCYVDTLYPEVGVSAYKLLKSLGVEVYYPEKQTCCGQPMGNAGFQDKADKLVERFDDLFRGFDYVVARFGKLCGLREAFSSGNRRTSV